MYERSRLFNLGQPRPARANTTRGAPARGAQTEQGPKESASPDALFQELRRECKLRHGVASRRAPWSEDPRGWWR